MSPTRVPLLAAVLLAFLPFATAQATYAESEPNDLKSQANGPFVLQHGDRIAGASSATSDSDYWLLQTAPQPAGIYEHRLTPVTGTISDLSIRGLRQTNGAIDPTSDFPVQLGTPGFLRWYGFGASERLYVRKVGSVAESYAFRYTRQPFAPARLPSTLEAGPITIQTLGATSADLWIYDAALRPIREYGNDDGQGTSASLLRRSYSFEPGVYYLAVTFDSSSQLLNLANDQPSPVDDANRNREVLEFPDAIACAEGSMTPAPSLDVAFTHGDPARTVTYMVLWGGPGAAHFLEFRVAPQNPIPSALARSTPAVVQPAATTPQIAITNQDLYLALGLDFSASRAIGVLHSMDGGQSFTGPATPIPGSTNGLDPCVDADGSHVAVGYARVAGGGVAVDLAASADSGQNWNVTTLTTGGFALGSPDLAFGMGGALSVLYKRRVSTLSNEIAYQASSDHGVTLGAPMTVSQPGVECSDPSIARRDQLVFAAWTQIRPVPSIEGRYSMDGGASWQSVLTIAPLSGAGGNAQPEVAIAEDGTVGVTYMDTGPGHTHPDVYFTQSVGTASFRQPVCVSRSPERASLRAAVASHPWYYHLVWTEDDGGTPRTYQCTVPVASDVPPSSPVPLTGSGTPSSFACAAARDDLLAFAYAQGTTATDVVLHTARGPWHTLRGHGGCGDDYGVPVCTVRGDLATAFTLHFGPAEPNAFALLALAGDLAPTKLPLGGDCALELDPNQAIGVLVQTDATGNYSLPVPFGVPGDAVLQAGFFDMGGDLSVTHPLGVRLNFR